jgi:hypothetical protein
MIEVIKERLREGDFSEAADELYVLLFSSDTLKYWTELYGKNSSPKLIYTLRKIVFAPKVKTAHVKFSTGVVAIGSQFFLDYVETLDDVLLLIRHERDHVLIKRLFYQRNAYYARKIAKRFQKLGHDAWNFAEDAYINANSRRKIRSMLPERFYRPALVTDPLSAFLMADIDTVSSLVNNLTPGKGDDLLYGYRELYAGSWIRTQVVPKRSSWHSHSLSHRGYQRKGYGSWMAVFGDWLLLLASSAEVPTSLIGSGHSKPQKKEGPRQGSGKGKPQSGPGQQSESGSGSGAGEKEDGDGKDEQEGTGGRFNEDEQDNSSEDTDEAAGEGQDNEDNAEGEDKQKDGEKSEDLGASPPPPSDTPTGDYDEDASSSDVDDVDDDPDLADFDAYDGEYDEDDIENPEFEQDDEDDAGGYIDDLEVIREGVLDNKTDKAPRRKSEVGGGGSYYQGSEVAGVRYPSMEEIQFEIKFQLDDDNSSMDRNRYMSSPEALTYNLDKIGDMTGDVLARCLGDPMVDGTTAFPPEHINRRDAFTLACGYTPVTWRVGMTLAPQPRYDFYVDVSGSMYSFLPLINHAIKVLTGYVDKLFNFSDVVVEASPDDVYYYSTGGNTDCPVRHILSRPECKRVIVLTDDYFHVSDAMLNKASRQLDECVMLRTGKMWGSSSSHYSRYSNFQKIATKIIDLK